MTRSSPLLALNRTHPARCDDSWLPVSLMRGPRGAFAGAVWTSFAGSSLLAGLAGGLPLLLPGALLLGWLAASAYVIGDGTIQRTLRARLYRRLRQNSHELAELLQQAERELVCVRGRVHAENPLHGVLSSAPAVYRRLFFQAGSGELILHEAAVDFWLVQSTGRLAVRTSGSQLVTPTAPLHEQPADFSRALLALPTYPELEDELRWRCACAQNGVAVPPLRAGEYLLREGDELLVIGRREIHPSTDLGGHLAREEVLSPTLTAGRVLPLLLVPLAPAARLTVREV